MSGRDTASYDLLLGWYAVESRAIDREQLVKAAREWGRSPEKSLSEILAGIGLLDAGMLARLEDRARRELGTNAGHPGPGDESADQTDDRGNQTVNYEPIVTVDYPGSLIVEGSDIADRATEEGDRPGGRRFHVLRSRARGGLGEVFLALDTELNRPVAVKELQARNAHDPASQARFLFEAEVTGRLEHPGIVPVYSLNRHHDGRPYYAMRLLEGGTLREAIEQFHRIDGSARGHDVRELAFRRLLRSVIDACNAVAYAHSRGVVHRDLKPENVMLGRFGETLVVDWGIAKLQPGGGGDGPEPASEGGLPTDPSMTRPGSLIGTPRYMSPEQAVGDLEGVGPSSDIYSLGAILYCVLVGHDAFQVGDTSEVLDRVRRGIFPTPRRLRRSIDPGLEAVCMRAMSLAPRDRHATALELAEELETWLTDVRFRAEHETALLQVRYSVARLAFERARHSFGRGAHGEGMLYLSRALEDAPSQPPGLERAIRMNLRTWLPGANLLERRFRHGGEVHAVIFCPEGRKLATAGADRTARLWDLATGSPLTAPLKHEATVRTIGFRPDGSLIATAGDDGLIRIWHAVTAEPFGEPIRCGSPINDLSFSPDGTWIAAPNALGGPFLWDVASGKPAGDCDEPRAPILAVAFAPDAETLAIARFDGVVQLLELSTGLMIREPLLHDSAVAILAFNATGGRLLTGCLDGKVRVWDVDRGVNLVTLAEPGGLRCLTFRPGTDVFAISGEGGSARLRDSATGRPIGERLEHTARVDCLAFSPDGAFVATGGQDGTVRLWCALSGLPIGPPLKHGGAVRRVVFSRDGGRLISGGSDATVRCWAIPGPLEGNPERVSYWVRVMTNLEFDEGEAIRPMDGPTGWDLRRRLNELGGPPLR